MLFQRIIYYALLIGILAGLVVTLMQSFQVMPIIQSAEVFEGQSVPVSSHLHNEVSSSHSHGDSSWTPSDGFERTFYTFLANSFTAMGFSMLLLSVMMLTAKNKSSTKFDWRSAMAWGGAGYLIFFLAPSFGLPPEIPLANAAPVETRQLWWSLTALSTAAGLAGLVFGKAPWRWAMPALIVLPHLVGAPHINGAMFDSHVAELEQLAQSFITATTLVNFVLWLVLGLSCVWAMQKINTKQGVSNDK